MQEEQSPTQTNPESTAEPTSTWQFTGAEPDVTPAQTPAPDQSVSWTASEFIAHDKSGGWYVLFALVTAAAAVAAYFLTSGDKLSTGVVVIAGILFGVMAARKPRELPYQIDSHGVQIGQKRYAYQNFKSFSLVQEEGVESIWLMPLQRFMPGLSIYFAPTDRDKIAEILADYLPVEQREIDVVDRLMHKIRF